MNSRLHITVFLGLAIAGWTALLWLRGVPITWDHLWPFGLVVSFLSLVGDLVERRAWAWPFIRDWFVKRPDLRGTWRVVLKNETVDPGTGRSPDPIMCYMAVRQTLSTLSMRLMTPESSSSLVAQRIVLSNDGVFQVTGVYINTPQLELRGDRSEMHYGAVLLDVHGEPPTELEGQYWTDRRTRGKMRLTDCRRGFLSTYAAAESAFGEHQVT